MGNYYIGEGDLGVKAEKDMFRTIKQVWGKGRRGEKAGDKNGGA